MFRPDRHSAQLRLLSYPGKQVEQLELRSRLPMHSEQFVLGSKLVAKHVWQSVAGSPPGRAHTLQSVSVNLSGCRQREQLVTGSLLGRQLVQSEVMSQPGRHWVQTTRGEGSNRWSVHVRVPSAWHVATRGLFWGVVVQSDPQKPGEHSTLKLMVMWDMLWNPVNVISSVKSAPSWRVSRSINKLSIMFGSLLSTASMKNWIRPYI